MDKDRPEAVKSHVGAMTKGLPTTNLLTSVTQTRHPDVAFANPNAKKYSLQGQTAPLQNTTGVPGHKSHTINVKSEVKVPQHSASLLRANSSILPSPSVKRPTVKNKELCVDDFLSNKDANKKDEAEQNCYLLPVESGFSVPLLPSDPLDWRPLSDVAIPKDVPLPSPLDPPMSVWEG